MVLHWGCWNIAFHHVVVEAEKSFGADRVLGCPLLWALSELLGEKSPWCALRADMPPVWIKHQQGADLFGLTASRDTHGGDNSPETTGKC